MKYEGSSLLWPFIHLQAPWCTSPSKLFYYFQETVTESFYTPSVIIRGIAHKACQPNMRKSSLIWFTVSLRQPLPGSGQLAALMVLLKTAFQIKETWRMWELHFWSVQPRVWGGTELLCPRGGSGGPLHRPAAVPGCGQGAGLGLEANKQRHSCAGLCPLPSMRPPLLRSQSRTPIPCSSPRPPPYFPCTSPGSTEADLSFSVFKTGIETMPE